jgi:hypothetical protein
MALALHKGIIRNLSVSSIRFFYNWSYSIDMFDALTLFCIRLLRFARNDTKQTIVLNLQ